MGIKRIIEESDTRAGRVFDVTILLLILISLASFSIETLPGLTPGQLAALRWVEIVTITLFTVEYVLRVAVSSRRRSFVFSFFGLVDLIAILPFYLSLGIDLRAVRALRLLRVIRVFKLARYNSAVRRLSQAAAIIKEELILFLGVALMLIYLSAVGIYYFERTAQPDQFASIFDSLWWAVITLTTVGYGDAVPVTVGGRIFTVVMLIIGLGIVAVPTGLIASALGKVREEE